MCIRDRMIIVPSNVKPKAVNILATSSAGNGVVPVSYTHLDVYKRQAMYSGVQINGQPVEFTFALILMNMIPVIIVAILVALGLKFIPEKMINGFQIFAKFLVALITLGLAAAVVKFLLGWELIPGLDPIFMAPGDKPGEVMRAIEAFSYTHLDVYKRQTAVKRMSVSRATSLPRQMCCVPDRCV